ncbi:MAG: cytochrome c nitrite reductase small subunit [Phycisphaerales bacterium]|nr:cytochrome c nitrite reductase small subunit [Planctomycetota bacterium]MCH8508930.1 cytochrome c nitrite reductase small subunit [Phycisphaerales bacterium]
MTRTNAQSGHAPNGGCRNGWRRGLIAQVGFLPIAACVLLGMLAGIGSFTFGYGQGASYLSNDPAACANCHVMQDHYNSWQNSSHKHVATCNDCHLSHHPIGKWITKGDNGFFHSLAFTTGNYPDPIRIKPRNSRVTQNACLQCHSDFVHSMLPQRPGGDMLSCVHCHSDVGHAHR